MGVTLTVDVAQVCLDGRLADEERVLDVLEAMARDPEGKDVRLALGEPVAGGKVSDDVLGRGGLGRLQLWYTLKVGSLLVGTRGIHLASGDRVLLEGGRTSRTARACIGLVICEEIARAVLAKGFLRACVVLDTRMHAFLASTRALCANEALLVFVV